MSRYYYDLHLHSCLSPCGDDDNTPNNIAGMASLSELDIVALTDHNTSKNCPAFFKAAQKYGITPIAGMELTTSEDIHVVCLFERLKDAMEFDRYVEDNRFKLKNRPDIFGRQTVLDENDNPKEELPYLLTSATEISIEDVVSIVKSYGGVCYPAHIDRDANGLIAVLGTIPPDSEFSFYELRDRSNTENYSEKYGIDKSRLLVSSDAHYLTDIKDKENYIELCCDTNSKEEITKRLFEFLRGE